MLQVVLGIILLQIGLGIIFYIIYVSGKKISKNPYFVVVPSYLYLNNEVEQEENNSITEDPILRKAMGLDLIDFDEDSVKKVTIRVRIDMTKVLMYFEWTNSKYSDEKILSDSTLIRFTDGTEVVALMTYDQFDEIFYEYENARQRNIR
jgi:hypothetical protein